MQSFFFTFHCPFFLSFFYILIYICVHFLSLTQVPFLCDCHMFYTVCIELNICLHVVDSFRQSANIAGLQLIIIMKREIIILIIIITTTSNEKRKEKATTVKVVESVAVVIVEVAITSNNSNTHNTFILDAYTIIIRNRTPI